MKEGLDKKLLKKIVKVIESEETERLHEDETVAYVPVKIRMSSDGKHIGMIQNSISEIMNMYNRIVDEKTIEEIRKERYKQNRNGGN